MEIGNIVTCAAPGITRNLPYFTEDIYFLEEKVFDAEKKKDHM